MWVLGVREGKSQKHFKESKVIFHSFYLSAKLSITSRNAKKLIRFIFQYRLVRMAKIQ